MILVYFNFHDLENECNTISHATSQPVIDNNPVPEDADVQTGQHRVAPTQEKILEIITSNSAKIVALQQIKNTGLATSDQLDTLKSLKVITVNQQKKLDQLKRHAQSSQKSRDGKKNKIDCLMEKHPELMEELSTLIPKPIGRPSLEAEQPLLLKTIVDIICPHASAEARRRSELLRSCVTLNDLHNELKNEGHLK